MSSGGFPSSHTTSTTTKVTPLIWFDSSYVKTTPGLIKAITIGINLLAVICISIGGGRGRIVFFGFVSMLGFWTTFVLLGLYLFHLIEKYHMFPWLLAECIFCSLWTILYLLGSIFILFEGGAYAAAGFFGFLATALYGMDAFLKFKAYKEGEIAQGERTATTNAA